MAIETRTVNGSLTEIYVGGGNFITQAFPTNFHEFWTKKILTSSESIEDFKEVTSAEMNTIKNQDAKYKAPSEELKAQWRSAGAVFNEYTGFGEFNGITNLTAADMRHVLNNYGCMRTVGRLPDSLARTNFGEPTYPSYSPSEKYSANLYCKFLDFKNIEVIVLDPNSDMWVINVTRAFSGCSKLREIRGAIRFNDYLNMYPATTDSAAFEGCIKLREVRISHKCNRLANIDLKWSPLLSLDSISYLIENKGNTAQLTVTLHPDAYARLTDEIITAATAKQITFATTQ